MDGRKVLCIRFEDIPDACGLSYTKAQFVEEVKRTKTGKANIKRCFPSGPKKATAIFVDCLSECLQALIKGISLTPCHILTIQTRISSSTQTTIALYLTETMSTHSQAIGGHGDNTEVLGSEFAYFLNMTYILVYFSVRSKYTKARSRGTSQG